MVLVDAGNAFAEPAGEQNPTYLSRREQQLYLRTMDMGRYDVAAIGRTELLHGLEYFRNMTRSVKTPFLVANVARAGVPIAPRTRILHRGDLAIAIIGLLDPPRGRAAGFRFEENVTDLSFDDPVETLRITTRPIIDFEVTIVADLELVAHSAHLNAGRNGFAGLEVLMRHLEAVVP